MAVIRDFIYLDIERVRSFYAQLVGGLPTERSVQSVNEHGVDGSAEVKTPLFGAKIGADNRYHRSSMETKSLHDQIMVEFMDGLEENNLLHKFSIDFLWERNSFNDGMFILVSGPIRIIDYKLLASEIDRLSHLAKTIDSLGIMNKDDDDGSSIQGNRQQRRKAQRENRNRSEGSLQKKMEDASAPQIASFLEHHMRDTMRILVFPTPDLPKNHFVATAIMSAFRFNTVALQGQYGHTIDADWKCLLQVNKGARGEMIIQSDESHNEAGGIETALESVIDGLSTINTLKQGIEFPRVAATPIAIYREIPVKQATR